MGRSPLPGKVTYTKGGMSQVEDFMGIDRRLRERGLFLVKSVVIRTCGLGKLSKET